MNTARGVLVALFIASLGLNIFFEPRVPTAHADAVSDTTISVSKYGSGYTAQSSNSARGVCILSISFLGSSNVKQGFKSTSFHGTPSSPCSGASSPSLSVTETIPSGTSTILVRTKIGNSGGSVVQKFDTTPVAISEKFLVNDGPASSTVLIHEFNDEVQEATAFESAQLDLMDWPPPKTFIDRWVQPGEIVATGKAGLSKSSSGGMFQLDLNNWNFPTNNKALRQALGYVVDRQQIVNVYAGGLALPICGGVGAGGSSALTCVQLGYPSSFGDFNPAKALQVLYEGGWRDANNNGILEAPNGQEPTLVFYVRLDDGIRRQAGDELTNTLRNLPKSFVSKTGPSITVCGSSAVCKINVDERVLSRAQIASIVFRGTGSKVWNLYTGGWSSAASFPDAMFYLYTSGFAWSTCGGGWTPNVGGVNYPCNVDPTFDSIAQPLVTSATMAGVLSASRALQQYGWGYASGKIAGTMPTVPMYTRIAEEAFYNSDVGTSAVTGAQWKGWIGQETGFGLGEIVANIASVSLYNGQTGGAGYVSYRGQGVLDWGFKSQVQAMNPVFSEWLWDILAMQQTYDSCLVTTPLSAFDDTPSMCSSSGETTAYNDALGKQVTVAVYKFQDGLFWSDGQTATAEDFKFSIEYVQKNSGFNFGRIQDVLKTDVIGADAARGIGGTAVVYFDDVGASFLRNVGLLPVIAKHVWCPDYDGTPAHNVGYGVAPRAGCPYPSAELFPDFDFTKHVGTGPYVIDSCTGVSCSETITLKPNPYYTRGTAYWDVATASQLQSDVNRDDRVNQADKDLLTMVDPEDPLFDVDYRLQSTRTETFTNTVGMGTFTVMESGPEITSNDQYIVDRLIFDGITRSGDPQGLVWPPAHTVLTYVWPDVTKDNSVDLDDVISVYLHQFQDPHNISTLDSSGRSISLNDVDYSGDISLDDLIITFVRQFTKPAGVP